MAGSATRYLYLARHGEASGAGTLTEAGRRQAVLLGDRLRGRPLTAVWHGPLPRARETARLVGGRLGQVPLHQTDVAGDYLPYVPAPDELPPESVEFVLDRLARLPASEREAGRTLAPRALERFAGPVDGDEPRHELIVTHNFLVGWFVRDALDAPEWRWFGLDYANAALTVIRYTPGGRPACLVVHNDVEHLPAELRWTGSPQEDRV
ncbi:probable phosphoglycerate mutase [Streptomyces sp. WMMB 714]|jgi:broad specificity phosphatase PhoE|uniref:histidine phosphatase family protein n=1 Tax=Streptomyces sp. WMMB 714 TaxID=1286822 RepID=UPI0005F83A7F|nr:histidine phosphatase family protein [Streptomyces sp. WMMB 714]SCK35912.1 probable phosphoglycerate mutase [Streptomyces sp. WMMB 714]